MSHKKKTVVNFLQTAVREQKTAVKKEKDGGTTPATAKSMISNQLCTGDTSVCKIRK